MTKTVGELNGIILSEKEAADIHLWLEDYYQTLKGYETFKMTEKHRLALEIREKKVLNFLDDLLKELT